MVPYRLTFSFVSSSSSFPSPSSTLLSRSVYASRCRLQRCSWQFNCCAFRGLGQSRICRSCPASSRRFCNLSFLLLLPFLRVLLLHPWSPSRDAQARRVYQCRRSALLLLRPSRLHLCGKQRCTTHLPCEASELRLGHRGHGQVHRHDQAPRLRTGGGCTC